MRKIFTSLSLAAMFMVGTSANAQVSASINEYPATGYSTENVKFSFTEVANALGTDTATLAKALTDGTAKFGIFDKKDIVLWQGSEAPSWSGIKFACDTLKSIPSTAVDTKFSFTYETNGMWMQYCLCYNIDGWPKVLFDGNEDGFFKSGSSIKPWDWNVTKTRTDSYALNQAKIDSIVAGGSSSAIVAGGVGEGATCTFKQFDVSYSQLYESTADGGDACYWMTSEGIPAGYQEGVTVAYNGPYSYDAAADAFYIPIGQFPSTFSAGDSWTGNFVIKYNGKEATLTTTLNVVERPTMAEPAKYKKDLEILKTYEGTVEFYAGKEYEDKTLTVDMSDIYTVLGADKAALEANIASVTKGLGVKTDTIGTEAVYSVSDSLLNPIDETNGWFGRYTNYDETTGATESLNGTQSYILKWSASCTYYLQNYTLTDGTFTLTYGQYTNTMKEGDADDVYLYIVNGTKAVALHVTASVTAAPTIDFSEMTNAGEQTVEVSAAIDDSYATKQFSVDINAVTTALGCTAADLDDFYALASEGALCNDHNTNGNGYYFNNEGFIQNWNTTGCSFYIDPVSLADGTYNIGQMSGCYTNITNDSTCTAKLYYQYGTSYYVINVKYTVLAPTKKADDFTYTLKSSESVTMQIIPSASDWAYGTTTTLDLDYINSVIGTTDFVLYTDVAKVDTLEDGSTQTSLVWSKNYTCTPAPGFWYGLNTYENAEHQVVVDNAGWGSNSFGITYASGVITWYQYPGQRATGDAYLAYIYLANDETGDYMRYALNVRYVDEVVPDAEIAGTLELPLLFDANSDDYSNASIDLDKLAELLNADKSVIAEGANYYVANSASMFSTIDLEGVADFNTSGYVVSDESAGNIKAGFRLVGSDLQVYVDQGINDIVYPAKATLAIEYDGKRVLVKVTVVDNQDDFTGVKSVNAATASAKAIYNVAGAKVSSLKNGINIVKMSDGSVKKIMK